MIVTLDGERVTGPFPAGGTLQALIDQVRAAHLGDRLVVSVAVEGQPLLDRELSQRLEGPLDGVEQVDLTSADRWQLAADSLREVAERLSEAGNQQAAVAEQLHAGNVSEAVKLFGGFLETWQVCQRTILECSRLLDQDLTAVECSGRPVREHLDGLADKLRELRDTFEARDMVLLADQVQYEMPDICQVWQGILNELATNLAARAGGPQAGAPAS
ncbi:MAG: hypothetical protein ACE5I3_15500 [Phycisphaerae bacterium]